MIYFIAEWLKKMPQPCDLPLKSAFKWTNWRQIEDVNVVNNGGTWVELYATQQNYCGRKYDTLFINNKDFKAEFPAGTKLEVQ